MSSCISSEGAGGSPADPGANLKPSAGALYLTISRPKAFLGTRDLRTVHVCVDVRWTRLLPGAGGCHQTACQSTITLTLASSSRLLSIATSQILWFSSKNKLVTRRYQLSKLARSWMLASGKYI